MVINSEDSMRLESLWSIFIAIKKRLAIEVDGGIHERADIAERDINRTFELERLGVKIIRFRNDDIFERLANVLREIGEVAKAL